MEKSFILILVLLCSCTTIKYSTYKSGFDPESVALIESIPYGSSKIVMTFKYSPEVCYDSIYRRLLLNSYTIERENKNAGSISATIVAGDGALRANALCNNNKILITGEYLPSASSINAASYILGVPMTARWTSAVWTHKQRSRTINVSSAVFAHILRLFRPLSNSDTDIIFTPK